jgi:rRNA small subunit pseudouridine methyltransferase Nep1
VLTLNFIIAESALELIPEEIRSHPSVRSDARRRGVEVSAVLLDRSIHHAAMLKLKDSLKRGRPDLVHLTLLSVTSAPIYQDGMVRVFIHTGGDTVLQLKERTRPPKSYARFRNLVEKLLQERPSSGLVTVYDSTIAQLLKSLRSSPVVGLSVQGAPLELPELARELASHDPAVLIGGFSKGHFLPSTVRAVDRLVRIHERPLDAHVVAARLVYEVEKLTVKRGV